MREAMRKQVLDHLSMMELSSRQLRDDVFRLLHENEQLRAQVHELTQVLIKRVEVLEQQVHIKKRDEGYGTNPTWPVKRRPDITCVTPTGGNDHA